MKKTLICLFATFILFGGNLNFVQADFWQRSEERERDITSPQHYTSEKHDRLPTSEPTPPSETQPTQPEPTSPISPTDPTETPAPPIGGVDENGEGGDEEGNGNGQEEEAGEEEEEVEQEEEVVSQVLSPPVLGLSDTSSSDFVFSDIMLLTGALCLTLYLKSKVLKSSHH